MTLKVQFGERLAQLRKEAGLSQEELAGRAGLHRTYISSLERGFRNPTITTLGSLADALNCSLCDLLKGLPRE